MAISKFPRNVLHKGRNRDWRTLVRQPISPAAYAKLCRFAVVLLGLIVVTGAAVRLTKSGLGCPTWPQCGDGSFVTRSTGQLPIMMFRTFFGRREL